MIGGQGELFEVVPRYCIDTNVIVSFLKRSGDEMYGSDVFLPQWRFIEKLVNEGGIVAPRQVERELTAFAKQETEIRDWLVGRRGMFRDIQSDGQLACAKKIVNSYPAYGMDVNHLGDLEVITLAHALQVPVISLERGATTTPSRKRPKIPDVCEEFGLECLLLPDFLRHAGFTAV